MWNLSLLRQSCLLWLYLTRWTLSQASHTNRIIHHFVHNLPQNINRQYVTCAVWSVRIESNLPWWCMKRLIATEALRIARECNYVKCNQFAHGKHICGEWYFCVRKETLHLICVMFYSSVCSSASFSVFLVIYFIFLHLFIILLLLLIINTFYISFFVYYSY